MAPTDFLRLYQELGIAPGASLEDMRRAYRRRASALHPDRSGMTYSATEPGAGERLQQITALYSAAMQFHRQHGRLPGAAVPPRSYEPSHTTHNDEAPPPVRRSSRMLWLLGAVVVLIWLIWFPPWADNGSGDPESIVTNEPVATEPAPIARVSLPHPAEPLRVGMTADKVLEIQGQPVSRADGRWDYGPSWIMVDENKVVDWYSSPMRPLKSATKHPPPPPPPHAEP